MCGCGRVGGGVEEGGDMVCCCNRRYTRSEEGTGGGWAAGKGSGVLLQQVHVMQDAKGAPWWREDSGQDLQSNRVSVTQGLTADVSVTVCSCGVCPPLLVRRLCA